MATPNPLSLLGFGKKPAPAPTPATAQEDAVQAGNETAPSEAPLLTVVKGNPTDEELAALTAVVAASAAQAEQNRETTLEHWQRRLNTTQQLGARLRPGPGSWKRARPQ